MKKLHFLLLFASIYSIANAQKASLQTPKAILEQQRAEFELLQTADLNTGTIPKDRLQATLERISAEEANKNQEKSTLSTSQVHWLEVGPTNVGGRVRALWLTSASTAIAGGV